MICSDQIRVQPTLVNITHNLLAFDHLFIFERNIINLQLSLLLSLH